MTPDTPSRYALSLCSVLFLAGCTGPPDKPEAMGALPKCGWTPNCVNTQSGEDVHASEPIESNAEQWQQLKAWIAQQDDWEVSVEEEHFLQAVVRTPVMRFRDDVQLLFLPDQQLIHVRSSSRLGISDLGTNAQRVELLRTQVERRRHPWSADRSTDPKQP